MTEKYLVAMEISKKQNYIFKSNKLKENIGASLIIKYVTEDLPYKYLYENKGELIFQGGGGSFFKFETKNNAEDFIKKLSFEIMQEYPEIEFFATFVKYTKEVDGEKELRKKLADKKLKRQLEFKKLSFGIEEICRVSGLPAYKIIDDEKNISNKRSVSIDTYKKWNSGKSDKTDRLGIVDIIKKDLETIKEVDLEETKSKYDFSEFKNSDNYQFPYDLDKFKKDGNSRLAVVAIDGNAMGNMVNKLKEAFKDNQANYFKNLKEFSYEIDKCYKEAFKKMVKVVEENRVQVEFYDDKYIPIRPIILAGDDVCYIVESSIALETANIFIRALEELGIKFIKKFKGKKIDLGVEKLTACGGIAFVNKKYPFFKACELAEDLCKNAKSKMKKLEKVEISMLDWHISKGELSNEIKDIRKRYGHLNYVDKVGKEVIADYNIKPIFISGENEISKCEFSYAQFKGVIKILKKNRRGKLKEIINEIPNGKSSVELFIEKYNLEKLVLELNEKTFKEQNESSIYRKIDKNEIIVYYDALEIMDDFKELEAGENNE